MPQRDSQRIRLSTLRRWTQERKPFAMLTCYDATTAQWLWRGGVQTLLVGDTAAQFILGHESTLPANLDFMLQITAAVRRGAPAAFIMGDMPFGSYQCGQDAAVAHAIRFLTEGGADVVKLEVDATMRPLVERLSHAGVPVVAHVGSRPQLRQLQGGHSRKIYRTAAEVQQTVDEALGMVEAGAVMLLFEAVPAEITRQVSQRLRAQLEQGQIAQPVPIIGCGGGPDCDGHVIVLHDLLGLTDWHAPFAKPVAQLGEAIRQAAAQWVTIVSSGDYLRRDHPYRVGG